MEIEQNTVFDNLKENAITVDNNFPSKLDNLINNIITKEGYKSYEVERKSITTKGGSYLGDLYEIDVKGVTGDGTKETNIFVKKIVSNGDNMKLLSIDKVYKTETFAYKELCKDFNDLQDEFAIPTEERFKMVKSFDESNSEAIILENIARKGYKTAHRMDVVSIKYAEQAIKQLAKFHALSFVIKEKRPEFFNTNIKAMEMPLIFAEDWQDFIKSMCELSMNCLGDEMRWKMESVFPRLTDKFSRYMQDVSNVNCLCHGDYRPNNIMVKEFNGDVVDLIPIDYQLLHFGSPVHDFLYFIYTSTDGAFRKKYLQFLKDAYLATMEKFLGYFDMNAETIYPKAEFDKVLKERMDYGLMVTIIFGPFMFVDEDDVPDVSKDCMETISFKTDDKYKYRLREAIEEFILWGYLDDY